MPLTIVPTSKDITIIKIFLNNKLEKYLQSIGITLNYKVKILSQANGNMILSIKKIKNRIRPRCCKKYFYLKRRKIM